MAAVNGGVPPGFRFHPTDEELLHYYLKKKVTFEKFEMEVIREVDLNKIEPWDIQEKCRIGSTPQNEWYFFSHKDRKYPTGSRTNRATNAGFWKATGRDKCIRNTFKKIGMRKTLVFYRGRAPHGQKTDWIMHEYRLEDSDHESEQTNLSEDGWVVCRVFKKRNLFKVGNNGGGTTITQDQHLHINSQNPNQMPCTSLMMQMRDNPLYHTNTQQTFDLYKSNDLALNYSHIPPPMLTYCVDQSRGFEPELDQSARSDQDHQNLNQEWGMLVAPPIPHSHSSPREGGFEDANASSSSMQHMNHQITLRGEMDFWGYEK